MKILDRYILRAFLTNYVIALAVMIGLYVLLDLFVNIDEFTKLQSDSKFQTAAKIIDYYGYNLFLYFSQLAGTILLVAACCTLGRLHRTNELTAILATGTSLFRVAAPVVIASLFMNALWFFDQEVIIPRIADKLSRKHGDIEGRYSFSVWFRPDRDNALVSANQFHPRAREMRGVLIMKRDARGRMTEVIRADRAPWDEERGLWHLERGTRIRFAPESSVDAQAGPAGVVTDELGGVPVSEYPSDLTPKELALQQATMWTHFLSLPEIERLQERFAESGTTEFIKLKHQRLTVIFVNMILLCLGVPFFLNRERPSILVAGGKCILICGMCYVVTFICQNVGVGAGINPALPAWLPVLIFGPVAVVSMDGIKT